MENKDKRQALIDAFADYAMENLDNLCRDSGEVNMSTIPHGNNIFSSEITFKMKIGDHFGETASNAIKWQTLFIDMFNEVIKRADSKNKDKQSWKNKS